MKPRLFHFDDERRGMVVHRHDTPQPWINYLSNGRLHAFVSQAGGGMLWWRSPLRFRLTRYRAYNLPIDSPGFYLYIRHPDGTVWSPTFRPVETVLDEWSACHQPGRTVFVAEKVGVRVKLTFFIPPGTDALVWDVRLENSAGKAQELDLFAYAEFSQFEWEQELRGGYYTRHMMKTWMCREANALVYLDHDAKPYFALKPTVYFLSSDEIHSYSGDRDDFIGNYRHENAPQSVLAGRCNDSALATGHPCGALHNKVVVPAGGHYRLHYCLGVVTGCNGSIEDAETGVVKATANLRSAGWPDGSLEVLEAWWSDHFSAYQCAVPDPVAMRQINTWNPVNTVTAARFSRGINTWAPGTRGVGFRDTAQDMVAIAYRSPGWAIEGMRYLLSQQFEEGHTVHTCFPEDFRPSSRSDRSDNHLWLAPLLWAILAETRDFGILDETIPYLAPDCSGKGTEATVWEHMCAAVRFTENHLGRHGLPLTLRSDWNDLIGKFNKRGEGETVFAGFQHVLALKRLAEIARHTGRTEDLRWFEECRARQEAALLSHAWDGSWWRRGYDDDGNPVGSVNSKGGNLFLNPQSWAILAGVGTREQQFAGMDAVAEQLDIGYGLKLLHPPFGGWDSDAETLIGYGPGCGENGAVFCHANTWAIIAEATLGNGTRAWKYHNQLIPRNVIERLGAETYRAEPNAWVSNIVGPGNPRMGWGNVEHVTGTAAWMDIAATQYLLGVRAELDGLWVDPCLPTKWNAINVRRKYLGCKVDIEILNPEGVEKGVVEASAGGSAVNVTEGKAVFAPELFEGVGELRIMVRMGRL